MNPYLTRLRSRYEEIRAEVDGLQTIAATENRDLTEDELSTIEQRSEEGQRLAGQIASLTAFEQRSAAVAANAPAGDDGAENGQPSGDDHTRGAQPLDGGSQTRSTSNTTTQDRDPGHYRSAREGGTHSFFADLVRAREGDHDAARRLEEHNRALSTGVAGAGIVPPNWLVSEYESLARQGRVVANGVRRIELNNPAPITLPRQTSGTDNVIAEQATENTHPAETDAFATTTDTVTPKPTSGIQVVSRQMIDMANPAVDSLIYGDMLSVYNRKIEDKVVAALVAAAGAAVTTFATEAAFGTAQDAQDAVTDAAFAVWGARKLPATMVAMRIRRWAEFNKMRDADGRKLFPTTDGGLVNVDGVGSVQAQGSIDGLPVLVTEGLGSTAYPESILVFRASDTILFEGAMQRFRFEEVAGPESVKLGIWAYTGVIVRQAANSVRRVVVTAA